MAGADTTAAAPRSRPPGSSDTGPAERQLRIVISALAGPREVSVVAGWDEEPLGRALVFRLWPARVLHVVGDSPLAGEYRPLHRLSGSDRFYNLLERSGFASVEEVAAMPEGCWSGLRNCGTRFIAAVRQVLAGLPPGDAQATTGILPGSGGAAGCGGPVTPAGLPADAARALQVMAAWAVAEHGARTLADLLTLACDIEDLPPDVARSWDGLGQLGLEPLAGTALADGDLPRLACDLLGEVEGRRRLILTSRTFAPARRTYDSLAAEFGVGRERVRQLETSALQQLARAAAHDLYRPLRWRAASAARPGGARGAAIPGAPPWMGRMLSWLAGQPA